MKLAAIIVTYNRLDALQQSLARVLEAGPDRLVVVDNASTDATADWLAAQTDPRLQVLRLPENLGGAGGFAAGLQAAMQGPEPADWAVMFDDDAWPCADTFTRFRADMAGHDPDASPDATSKTGGAPDAPQPLGAVAAAVLHPDGTISEMNRPGRNPFWHLRVLARSVLGRGRRGFKVSDTDLAPGGPVQRIDIASFVGFFVSRGAVARIGLPEAGLFLYGDDVLYSLRLRRAGFAMELRPALRFEHDCATMDRDFVYRPMWKIYYHARNGVQIAREAAGPVIFPVALAYYTLVWWRRGRHCTAPERKLYNRMMRAGLRDGLLGRRGRNDAIH